MAHLPVMTESYVHRCARQRHSNPNSATRAIARQWIFASEKCHDRGERIGIQNPELTRDYAVPARLPHPPPCEMLRLAMPPISLMQSAPGPETVIDGVPYLYFAGTSYLGLAAHPGVIGGGCEAVRRYGFPSATTRARFGTIPP